MLIFQSCSTIEKNSIKIEGIARDAKRGAFVLADDSVLYFLEEVHEWGPEFLGKRVLVTGEIEEIVYKPEPNPFGFQKQEIQSNFYLIKSPKFQLAK